MLRAGSRPPVGPANPEWQTTRRVEPTPEPNTPPLALEPAPEPQQPTEAAAPQPQPLLSPEAQNAAAVDSLLALVQKLHVDDQSAHNIAARNALLKASRLHATTCATPLIGQGIKRSGAQQADALERQAAHPLSPVQMLCSAWPA